MPTFVLVACLFACMNNTFSIEAMQWITVDSLCRSILVRTVMMCFRMGHNKLPKIHRPCGIQSARLTERKKNQIDIVVHFFWFDVPWFSIKTMKYWFCEHLVRLNRITSHSEPNETKKTRKKIISRYWNVIFFALRYLSNHYRSVNGGQTFAKTFFIQL